MNEQDNKTRLDQLREAYALHPERKETALSLAQFYVDLGWYNEAMDLYRHLLQQNRTDFGLMLDYANLCFKRQDFDEAVSTLTQLTSLKPQRIEGWNNLGIVLLACKRDDDARSAFEKVLELEPGNPGALLNLGNYLHQHGDPAGAAAHFEQAVKASPDFADGWFNLGNVYRDGREYPKAIAAYRRALRYHPLFAPAWKNLGVVQELTAEYSQAESSYREALKLSKADAGLYTNMGSVCSRLGRHDEAKDYFLKAVKIAPRELTGWMGLRQLSLLKGDIETFVKATIAVLTRLDPLVIAQTCRILRELERFDDCDMLLGRAGALKKTSAEMDAEQLMFLQRGGKKPAEAALVLQRLLALTQPSDHVLAALAQYHLGEGDSLKAVLAARQCREDSLVRHLALWRALIRQEDLAEAENLIREFLERCGDCSDAWYELARILAVRSDPGARNALTAAFENGFGDLERIEREPALKGLFATMMPEQG